MISISRSQVHTLRLLFSRGLGLSARSRQPPILFQVQGNALHVRAKNDFAALEVVKPCASPEAGFAIPMEAFKRCEGTKPDLVTFALKSREKVILSWQDRGIPQVAEFPLEPADAEFPPLPDRFRPHGPELLTALRDAVNTTDRDATRYALSCLQLGAGRPGKREGRIVATDGHQLLVQSGFDFPWKDDVLILANRVLGCRELQEGSQIEIGKTENWLTLRARNWTVHLRIEKEAKFPRVNDHIPVADDAASTLHMSEEDAKFLIGAVNRLPAAKEPSAPVTVDLNGQVAVRAQAEDQPTPTEVVLAGSIYRGQPVLINTNREFLARALTLGFRDVQFQGQEDPAYCQDAHRHYVWAVLGKDGVINSSDQCVRIKSPTVSDNRIPQTIPEHHPPMTANRVSQTKNHSDDRSRPNGGAEPVTIDSLIETAEAVRTCLRDSTTQLSELIAALKQHRKQSKTLQSALSSIRALQGIEP